MKHYVLVEIETPADYHPDVVVDWPHYIEVMLRFGRPWVRTADVTDLVPSAAESANPGGDYLTDAVERLS